VKFKASSNFLQLKSTDFLNDIFYSLHRGKAKEIKLLLGRRKLSVNAYHVASLLPTRAYEAENFLLCF